MRTVCIDTSVVASIAIVEDGRALSSVADPDPRHHAEGLGDLFAQALAEAGLPAEAKDAGLGRIVVGNGPGPYTALRAGIAFASALGRGLNIPVLGVGSLDIAGLQALDILADDADATSDALVLTDAKRKEVYSALFDADDRRERGGLPRRLLGPAVSTLDAALSSGIEIAENRQDGAKDGQAPSGTVVFFVGEVPAHLADLLQQVDARIVPLDVAVAAQLADVMLAADSGASFTLDPQYLRRPDVHQK